METRYYLVTIQYNKDAEAENRTAPKGYNTLDDAVAAFHKQMGQDMTNATLGWALSIVFDSNGAIMRNEKWTRPVPVEEVAE